MTTRSQDTTTPQTDSHLARLFRADSGQDLIEYALLAALLGLGGVATVPNLAGQLAAAFDSVAAALNPPAPSQQGGNTGGAGGNGGHGHGGGGGHGGGRGGDHGH